MYSNDAVDTLNTSRDAPPDLEFRRRYIYDSWKDQLTEVVRQVSGPLMTPMWSRRWFTPRHLSPVAKLDIDGKAAMNYDRTLPDVDIAAIMIAQHQNQVPNATANADQFPFKLKAVGRVNGMDIYNRAGQPGGFVSLNVEIVP